MKIEKGNQMKRATKIIEKILKEAGYETLNTTCGELYVDDYLSKSVKVTGMTEDRIISWMENDLKNARKAGWLSGAGVK